MTKLIVAKNIGFCFGVKNAIEIAESRALSGEIYTFGQLIHNEQVVESLESKGIHSNYDLPFLCRQGQVLISAHGVSPEVENTLKSGGAKVYDATCPFVKKIHKIVAEKRAEGYRIVVIGNPEHPEVKGILGYAGDDAIVMTEAVDLPQPHASRYAFVCQTTFSNKKYQIIKKFIENYANNYSILVEFFDTICYTTKARQAEAEDLCSKCDFVLVLGSNSSSNTLRLADIAKAHGKGFAIITEISDLSSVNYNKYNTMAVLAAASAPEKLMQEVLIFMSETQDTIITAATEEVVATEVAEVAEVATVAEEAAPAEKKELTMEDIVASNRSAGMMTYKAGARITGKIISIDDKGVYLGIPGKKDGFIEASEMNLDGSFNPADYKVGDEIDAVIVPNKSKDSTYVALSKKEVDEKKLGDAEAEKALASDEFELTCNAVGKNGLLGKLGSYTVFVPASHIRIGFVKNLEDYVGKPLRLRVLPPKEGEEERRNKRSIVASQRVILEEERAAKEEAFWESMQPGAIVSGVVKRFTTFGAFISVRGFDCLAHISDLSWNKISDPATVLTKNETYDFKVLKVDRETNKVSLGYKQLQKTPYEAAAEKYPIGTVIKGKIERIFSYGAFVSIEDGVDGLVHVSQISYDWTPDATKELKVGDEIEAKIIGFDTVKNRITLSMKALLPEPEVAPKAEEGEESTESAEDKPRRPRASTSRKIEYNPDAAKKQREDRPRRSRNTEEAHSSEPKEYISDTGFATLGDLIGKLNLNLEEDTDSDGDKK